MDELGPERKHILRRAFFIAAGQSHVDRFEIEAGWLDLVQVLNGAVVGGDSEVVPGVDQPRGVEERADVRFAVFGFESRQAV